MSEGSVDERGCRRDIRSTVGPHFGRVFFQGRSGRRNGFSSFGAGILNYPQFPRAKSPGRNLVLTCSPTPSFPLGRILVPRNAGLGWSGSERPRKAQAPNSSPSYYRWFVAADDLGSVCGICSCAPCRSGAVLNGTDARLAAMVIVPRNRKVNRTSRFPTSPCATRTFAILRMPAALARLHPVHREP